jgi:hypothetical protein
MARERSTEEQQAADDETVLGEDVLPVLRARRCVPTEAVGVEVLEQPVVRRERRLVECDERDRGVAGKEDGRTECGAEIAQNGGGE